MLGSSAGLRFRALSRSRRQQYATAFITAYASERDGIPNPVTGTLSARERYMADLRSRDLPSWTGDAVSQAEFDEFHSGDRPVSEASPLVAWLVRTAKVNATEKWGIDYHLHHHGIDGAGGKRHLSVRTFAELEEIYHTELLKEVVARFGVRFVMATPPESIQRSVIAMSRLPNAVSYPMTLAGEIIGSCGFLEILERAEQLLVEDPATMATVCDMLEEIVVDEVTHVAILLASLNRAQLDIMRIAIPPMVGVMAKNHAWTQTARDSSITRRVENFSFEIFPERILKRAFIPREYLPNGLEALVGM